jgi:hypothetical protein
MTFDTRRENNHAKFANNEPENLPTDTNDAVRIANLLEGLEFPASKQEILDYISKRRLSSRKDIDLVKRMQGLLESKKEYASAYEVEREALLVRHTGTQAKKGAKPYARDRALNIANQERIGEAPRPAPPERSQG